MAEYVKVGECSRCGECCGDDQEGWCAYLIGRPPGPTSCTYEGYPKPCGDDGNWPYNPEVERPAHCAISWLKRGD